MCFSADISSIGCTICDCFYKCFYDTHHQSDGERDEGYEKKKGKMDGKGVRECEKVIKRWRG